MYSHNIDNFVKELKIGEIFLLLREEEDENRYVVVVGITDPDKDDLLNKKTEIQFKEQSIRDIQTLRNEIEKMPVDEFIKKALKVSENFLEKDKD